MDLVPIGRLGHFLNSNDFYLRGVDNSARSTRSAISSGKSEVPAQPILKKQFRDWALLDLPIGQGPCQRTLTEDCQTAEDLRDSHKWFAGLVPGGAIQTI